MTGAAPDPFKRTVREDANRFDDVAEYIIRYEKVYSYVACVGEMPKESTGKRLLQIGLSQDLVDRFTDFREAGYLGAPEHRIIAEALEFFMDQRLERNPDIKAGYDSAQARRKNR